MQSPIYCHPVVMEARAGIEPAIELLQSPALPLGYLAITLKIRLEKNGAH